MYNPDPRGANWIQKCRRNDGLELVLEGTPKEKLELMRLQKCDAGNVGTDAAHIIDVDFSYHKRTQNGIPGRSKDMTYGAFWLVTFSAIPTGAPYILPGTSTHCAIHMPMELDGLQRPLPYVRKASFNQTKW